jgi:hypothetical protein
MAKKMKKKAVKKVKKMKVSKKKTKKTVKKVRKVVKKAKKMKKTKAVKKPVKKMAKAKKPMAKKAPMMKPVSRPPMVVKKPLPQVMQSRPTAGKAIHLSLPRAAGDRPLGVVTHYYDRIGVGVLKLAEPLKIGDAIRVQKGETIFTQTVKSMQINRKQVQQAKANDDVAIKVDKPAHEGARIYKA